MVCKHYLRTFFIPDFIAVVGPALHIVSDVTPTIEEVRGDLEFAYRYVVLCCYFVRLQSLKKILKDILLVARLSSATVFVLSRLFTMTLMLHLLTSLVIAIPWALYDTEYPVQSWFKEANIHTAEVGVASVYAYSLLMTCCHFFGVAHGGYVITVPNEEIVMFLVSLIGRLYTLYMIADLLRIFGLVSVSESRYENITSQLNEYVRSINVPPHLRMKLLEYCKHKLHGHYMSEREIFKTLPNHIKTELLLHDAKRLILNIPVFQVLPKEQIGALIGDMQRNFYSPGDEIEVKGRIVDFVHFINTGTVAIYDGDNEVCHIEDGDTFGELLQFSAGWAHFTHSYVAIEYSDVYSLPKDRFIQLLNENEEVKKYFENKAYRKIRLFEYYKKNINQNKDIVSELRSRKVLETCKLKPHYVPE
nr:unnamed protein product [Callosobruchus analis]